MKKWVSLILLLVVCFAISVNSQTVNNSKSVNYEKANVPINTAIARNLWDYEFGDFTLSLDEGGDQLFLVNTDTNEIISNNFIHWYTSNGEILTIDNDGFIFPMTYGEVTVTADFNGYLSTIKVTIPKTSIDICRFDDTGLNFDDIVLDENNTDTQLHLVNLDHYGKEIGNELVTWSSSDNSVVSVDAEGYVIMQGVGNAIITAEYYGIKTSINITVTGVIKVTGVSLNKTSATINIGLTINLIATVKPNNATDKSVAWLSSSKLIAKVDQNGKVTALREGTTYITVKTTDGGYNATCKITVKDPIVHPKSVSLNVSSASLNVGQTKLLTATITPADTADKSLTWSTSNKSIVTVDKTGKIKAVKVGSATITVKTNDGGYTSTCKVTVTDKAVESVSLNKTSLNLLKERIFTLKAYITPSNAKNKSVTWKSSNTKVAKVDKEGKVTAIDNGTAKITVTTQDGNKTATCTVTVTTSVSGVKISPSKLSIKTYESSILSAVVSPSTASDQSVSWKSSDTKIVKVDASGKVTALSKGTAKITVTTKDKNKTATCQVTVTDPVFVTDLSLSPKTVKLMRWKSQTLSPTIKPSNATFTNVTWKSSNTKIAIVDKNGKVTGLKAGEATITATSLGKDKNGKQLSAKCKITVTDPIYVTDLDINPNGVTIVEGNSKVIDVTITPSNATESGCTYVSSDPSIATIDLSNNKIYAKKPGITILNFKSKGRDKNGNYLTATCKVVVIEHVLVQGIKLDKNKLSLIEGESASLNPIFIPAGATNKGVKWTSSNSNIVKVDNNGVIFAKQAGTATITVTTNEGCYTDTCKVTVKEGNGKVTSIHIEQSSPFNISTGVIYKLMVTVYPLNAANKTIIYKSLNPSIVTIDKNGSMTGLKEGTATITATSQDGNKQDSIIVKVTNAPVLNIHLNTTTVSLNIGKKYQIFATIIPRYAVNKKVIWSSDNEQIATVDQNGIVEGRSKGRANIYATTEDGKISAACSVFIK